MARGPAPIYPVDIFSIDEDHQDPVFDVRDYGAVGDTVTNDTSAFQRAAAALQAAGGGTLLIPPGVYIVGRQAAAVVAGFSHFLYGESIISIASIDRRVLISGYGAVLRMAPGLRFGAFTLNGDNATVASAVVSATGVLGNPATSASLGEMLVFNVCTGGVTVEGLELDGNSQNVILGGSWQYDGRQITAHGLSYYTCRKVTLRDVYTHHHCTDGIVESGTYNSGSDPAPVLLENVTSEYNGRNAWSRVSGNLTTAINCAFNHSQRVIPTGVSGVTGGEVAAGTYLATSPGAGVDIEGETVVDPVNSGVTLIGCVVLNNGGKGLVSDSGSSMNCTFIDCTFWGTTAYSTFITKPLFKFLRCNFYGAAVHSYSSVADPEQSTRFIQCHFEDKPHPWWGDALHGGLGTTLLPLAYVPDPTAASSAVVAVDAVGSGVSFDDCVFIGNRVRAVYLASVVANGITVRNSIVVERKPVSVNNDAYSKFTNTLLDNVRFMAEVTNAGGFASPYFNGVGVSAFVLGRCTLEGAILSWGFGGVVATSTQLVLPETAYIENLIVGYDTAARKISFGAAVHASPAVGDKWFNPTPSSPGYIGQVYTSAGWKDFGAIL